MAGTLKTKTGRRAPEGGVDRTMAREWVDLYRQAQQAPGGRLCLNPDDDPDFQTWIDATDPDPLLTMLEDFAEHGTFVWQDTFGVFEYLIYQEAKQRLDKEKKDRKLIRRSRSGEKGLLGPIEAVAISMNMSKSSLEKIFNRFKSTKK